MKGTVKQIGLPAPADGQRCYPNGSGGAPPSTASKSRHDSVAAPKNQIKVSKTPISQSVISTEIDAETPTGTKRASPAGSEGVPRPKRIRTETNPSLSPKSIPMNSTSVEPSEPERQPKAVVLPARRSTRHATVQSTQISEGTLRPPGPPHLQAALNIALRNLQSEVWDYLWSYRKKHPDAPLPTAAHVKQACRQAREAAEAVDKADRELEDAIDEMMRCATKNKRRVRPPSRKQPTKISEVDRPQVESETSGTDDSDSSSLSEQEDESETNTADEDVSPSQVTLASSRASSQSTKPVDPLGVQHNSPRARQSYPRRMRK